MMKPFAKDFLAVFRLLLLPVFIAGQAVAAPSTSCRITVNAKSILREINPLFFGVNTLFWIEDDAALKDGKLAQQLRDMPCHLMRFPGGEVADNYYWKTKKLDDTKQFPYEEGPDKLDCDKFMILCRQVGAEPIFVVNLESGLLHNNLATAIQEAADWVHYANKEKGYHVKYWEIGNETDLPVTRYPATVREYAEAVIKFSRAMKAVDPTIKIGVTGPHSINTITLVDRLSREEVAHLRTLPPGKRRKSIETMTPLTKNKPGDAWWPTLIEVAGHDMDFAIVHRYYPATFGPPVNVASAIGKLKQLLADKLSQRTIPIALTEWNAGLETSNPMTSALIVAELIGEYTKSGVDMACLWPLRYRDSKSSTLALLDVRSNEPLPSYTVMKLYASNMDKGSKLVETTTSSKSVYACASLSGDGQHLALFLLNKSPTQDGALAELNIAGFASRTVRAQTLLGGNFQGKDATLRKTIVTPNTGAGFLTLPPNSLTVLTYE